MLIPLMPIREALDLAVVCLMFKSSLLSVEDWIMYFSDVGRGLRSTIKARSLL